MGRLPRRAASHGIAAIIDPAGRTLAQASTFDGPVLLVADAPLAPATPHSAAAARPAGSRNPVFQRDHTT